MHHKRLARAFGSTFESTNDEQRTPIICPASSPQPAATPVPPDSGNGPAHRGQPPCSARERTYRRRDDARHTVTSHPSPDAGFCPRSTSRKSLSIRPSSVSTVEHQASEQEESRRVGREDGDPCKRPDGWTPPAPATVLCTARCHGRVSLNLVERVRGHGHDHYDQVRAVEQRRTAALDANSAPVSTSRAVKDGTRTERVHHDNDVLEVADPR